MGHMLRVGGCDFVYLPVNLCERQVSCVSSVYQLLLRVFVYVRVSTCLLPCASSGFRMFE